MYGKPDKSGHLIYRLVPSPSRYEIRQWLYPDGGL